MTHYQYIIVDGNPIDGIQFYGPFIDRDSAIAWADKVLRSNWWVAEMEMPL